MASDLHKKSGQTHGAQTPFITHPKPDQIEISAAPDSSPFTPEQRQILGTVYQLILGWRRERMHAKELVASAAPRLSSDGEA